MRAVTIVGAGGKSKGRTVVIRDSRRAVRQQILEHFAQVSKHLPASLRSVAASIVQPRALLILAAIFAACLVAGIYYYNQLASVIDARLQNSSLDNSVEIFTAPFRVSVGQRLPIDELIDYLHAAGYQQRSSDEENIAGSFDVVAKAISIYPGDAASSQAGVNPVRIQTDNNGRVLSLTSPVSKQRLSSALIEGELLATVRE
ncbi:MAG TPA: hypothetical protein VKF81_15390, partial [Blastocatellia bacterium]|nr:hypothetical protein [Blastocatellia bacterium]